MPNNKTNRAASGQGSIRQRADGRWEARLTLGYDEGTGKRKTLSIYGASQKEVKRKLTEKLRQLDPAVYDAALDLGCNPRQAFFKVVLPQLTPAILSAFLISLTYSIDDFIISYFTSGTMQTLPIAIYSMTKKKVSPEINALSAIMFVVILTIILAANAVDSAKERRLRRAARAEEGRR